MLLGISFLTSGLLGIALALAAASIWIYFRLNATYSGLIQQRLVDRAVELDLADTQDFTTRSAIISVTTTASSSSPATSDPLVVPTKAIDPTLKVIAELRSEDKQRVLTALKDIHRLTPVIAAQLIQLLAWDEIKDAVREALRRDLPPITGLLVDHVTNKKDVPFGIRRRIPDIF